MCSTLIGLQLLQCSPLQNVNILKMKSYNYKALQKVLTDVLIKLFKPSTLNKKSGKKSSATNYNLQ
jgi:hypothetical protein